MCAKASRTWMSDRAVIRNTSSGRAHPKPCFKAEEDQSHRIPAWTDVRLSEDRRDDGKERRHSEHFLGPRRPKPTLFASSPPRHVLHALRARRPDLPFADLLALRTGESAALLVEAAAHGASRWSEGFCADADPDPVVDLAH